MSIQIEKGAHEIRVECPYNTDFIRRAKELGGKWDGEFKTWLFPLSAENEIKECLVDIYGFVPDARMIKRTIETTEDITADRDAIIVCGVEIARAWGRDTGAKMQSEAILRKGKIDSGGSRQYWKTEIKKGSVIEVELPEGGLLPDGFVFVDDTEIRRNELENRRAKLLEELAQIDQELDSIQ